MKKTLWISLTLISLWAYSASADLDVVREVIIAPKNARVMANIGPVNQSSNVRLAKAVVDIHAGPLPARNLPVHITVHAVFKLVNESSNKLELTVGFPVSNSKYSSFEFKSFKVSTDGGRRSVFRRVSGYPRQMKHILISGPDPMAYRSLPDILERNSGKSPANLFGVQKIGNGGFQNIMVWRETFTPGETRSVSVDYQIAIPAQINEWRKKKVKGNYKGVWPQEANNLPLDFLKSIPSKRSFYFIDYYLVTGASWKGPIGEEIITLKLDPTWKGHKLFSNLVNKPEPLEGEAQSYTYSIRNSEPSENLYIALQRP